MANGLLKLDSAKIENSIGVLNKQMSVGVAEKVALMASTVKNSGDNNRVVQEFLEVSIKYQKQYNELVDSTRGFIKDAEEVYDISEYMAKQASVGDIANRDVSFQNSKIDSSKILNQ